MTTDEKRYLNWPNLDLYTKEFKEWIWKLFRKVHARIGHVEEELAKTREANTTDYRLTKVQVDDTIEYKLIETHTGTDHGTIMFDESSGMHTILWDDLHDPV